MEQEWSDENQKLCNLRSERSLFQYAINKAKRNFDISEKRKKNYLESFFEKSEMQKLMKMTIEFKNLLFSKEKLNSTENKNGKSILGAIRKLCKEHPVAFESIIESEVLIELLSKILDDPYYAEDLKYESLWITSLISVHKIRSDLSFNLFRSSLKYLNDVNTLHLPKSQQLVIYQKIAYIITNFIINNQILLESLNETLSLQSLISTLIDSTEENNVLIGVWLLRNLSIKCYKKLADILNNFSIQTSLLCLINSGKKNILLLKDLIWTIAILTNNTFDFEIFDHEFIISLIAKLVDHQDLYLPLLSVCANSLQFLTANSIDELMISDFFQGLIKYGISNKNILLKRETYLLISNLCFISAKAAYDIMQKEELISELIDLVIKKDKFLIHESIAILYNISLNHGLNFLKYENQKKLENVLKLHIDQDCKLKNSIAYESEFYKLIHSSLN